MNESEFETLCSQHRRAILAYAYTCSRDMHLAEDIVQETLLVAHKKRDQYFPEADFGAWTGRKLADLMKKPEWQQVQRYPSGFRFPDGESFSQMQERICDTIQALVTNHPGQTIVAVSHADPIKAAVADAMGTHLDLFQRIVVGPCSISAIMYTPSGPVVLGVNSLGDDLRALVPS